MGFLKKLSFGKKKTPEEEIEEMEAVEERAKDGAEGKTPGDEKPAAAERVGGTSAPQSSADAPKEDPKTQASTSTPSASTPPAAQAPSAPPKAVDDIMSLFKDEVAKEVMPGFVMEALKDISADDLSKECVGLRSRLVRR